MIWWPQNNDHLLLTHNTCHQVCTKARCNIGRATKFLTMELASRPQLAPRILRWLIRVLEKLMHPLLSSDMWRCNLANYHRLFGGRAASHLQRRRCMQQVLHTALQHSQDNFQSHIMKRSKLETFENESDWTTHYDRSMIYGFNQY